MHRPSSIEFDVRQAIERLPRIEIDAVLAMERLSWIEIDIKQAIERPPRIEFDVRQAMKRPPRIEIDGRRAIKRLPRIEFDAPRRSSAPADRNRCPEAIERHLTSRNHVGRFNLTPPQPPTNSVRTNRTNPTSALPLFLCPTPPPRAPRAASASRFAPAPGNTTTPPGVPELAPHDAPDHHRPSELTESSAPTPSHPHRARLPPVSGLAN